MTLLSSQAFPSGLPLAFSYPSRFVESFPLLVAQAAEDSKIVADDSATLYVLLGLVLVAMAVWTYGRWGSPSKGVSTRRKAALVAVVLLGSGIWLGFPVEKQKLEVLEWEKWTPERQAELLEQGRAVYVDYTAAWCFSCRVNKRVFNYESVIRKIRDLDVVLLQADWTKKGPVIHKALQSFGREAVPLNVYYKSAKPGPNTSEPILMPEFLTEGIVLEVLETGEAYIETGEQDFVSILGFALLGGLILNLMPCVFPVLGLKIMGFVEQAGEEKRKIAGHGLVFTGGVLVSFWILVGVLLWLRDTMQQELGWGFQLQEPGFVFVLAVVLLIFGLSLSGVFEIGLSLTGTGSKLTSKGGYSGSFFSGVLAVVVATPCMAPFLGVAVGAALAMKPLPALAIFTCVALGLSTPYLLLSIFPGWLSRLPRPGVWMEAFKEAMAFPIYATVVWLVWTLSMQLGG